MKSKSESKWDSFEDDVKDTFTVKEDKPKKAVVVSKKEPEGTEYRFERKVEVLPKEEKLTKEEKFDKWIRENATCSYCSVEVKERNYRLVDTKKKFDGKPVFEVVCSENHSDGQAPSLYVAEVDTEKGYAQIPARHYEENYPEKK